MLPGLKVGEGYTRHPFDEEFGVRTSGLVAGRHLQSGHRHDRHATAYYGGCAVGLSGADAALAKEPAGMGDRGGQLY